MFHTVVLQPSGRRFEVRQGESILEAGLRAGANLRYRCSNGTCGECRARLLGGEVEEIQFHDFCFSAAERAQGCLLMCSTTALGDVQLEAPELGAAADIPEQQVTAKLSRLELIGADYAIAHLRTPRSKTLQFLAGQEVLVRFEDGPTRRLALANCPCDGLRPQFHVRRIDGDPFSDQVFGALRSGATCEMRGPLGEFVLREETDRALLFIAYETGFAPVYSLLEHVIALDWRAPLRVIWLVEQAHGPYLQNYCRALQDALDDFTFDSAILGEAGQFVPQLQAQLQREPRSTDCDVYAVPPPDQAAATSRALQELGYRAERVRIATLPAI